MKRKYYYIVRCENGCSVTESVEYAENHFEAEKQAEKVYLTEFQSCPVEVSSRKITKAVADDILERWTA